MNEANDMVAMGAVATTVVAASIAIWFFTADESTIERRASRWAALSGIIFAVLVPSAEWALYTHVAPQIGLFMVVPSMLLTVLAMWFGGRAVYRMLGGGQEGPPPPVVIEEETQEHQSGIWCQLRELGHFRETLSGYLVNLATGDKISWTTVDGKKCIDIQVAGQTGILGARYETLTKYLAVQRGFARLLFAGKSSHDE